MTTTDLAANKAVASDASGKLVSVGCVSATEIGYLAGIASNIQTQISYNLNSSANLASVVSVPLTAERYFQIPVSSYLAFRKSDISSNTVSFSDSGTTFNSTLTFNNDIKSNLTSSRPVVTSTFGTLTVPFTTGLELSYVSGVSSSIEPQIHAKQDSITGGASQHNYLFKFNNT